MNGVFKAFPVALRSIFTDPINLVLSIFPTLIALFLYAFTIVSIFRNSDRYVSLLRGYIYTPEQATIIAKILTAILIIFVFFLMSWTFVLVVGIIAAPFNSLLSSRIEAKLMKNMSLITDQPKAIAQMKTGMFQTFKNEAKKLVLVAIVAVVAVLLNIFPLFYPLGIILVSLLIAVQFVDYSWSRYGLSFNACLKDALKNVLPYSFSGFLFLMMVAIPVVNAFIPAFATSYFTVLWLHRQKLINLDQ